MDEERQDAHDMPPRRRKGRRRRWIVLGTVVAVLAAGGIGFGVWHQTPGFCNAVCHQPMDPYVEGYTDDATKLAGFHGKVEVGCLDCHPAELDEQIAEARAWVAGDFATDEDGMLVHQGVSMGYSTCAQQNCHDFESVVATTSDWGGETGVNPHYSHQFYADENSSGFLAQNPAAYAMDCSYCHSSHGTSRLWCNSCHDFEVPEGWTSPGKEGEAA